MKTNKFRVWDKYLKHFVTEEGYAITASGKLLGRKNGNEYIECKNTKHLVIQYFTGLFDKEGKEIFEGDIVRSPDHCFTLDFKKWEQSPHEVAFRNNSFRILDFVDGDKHAPFLGYITKKHKVIGNIYENPDLLKIQRSSKKKQKNK